MGMNGSKRLKALALLVVLLGVATGAHAMMFGRRNVKKPAESEFGHGPRTSAAGLYTATLEPESALKKRKLLTVRVAVRDAQGEPVAGASIGIDGGMPQHGHGLPTRPRVAPQPEPGVYLIEGLRFNMGGWWELHLAIDGPRGSDRVTFNLAL
jgi:hypothetical protein